MSRPSGDRPRGLTDGGTVVLAAAVWAGAAVHRPGSLPLAVAGVVVAFVLRRPWLLWVTAAVLASVLGARSLAGLDPVAPGPFAGPVTLVRDPEAVGDALRVDVRAEGERYEAWARGSEAARLEDLLAGEVVDVEGRLDAPSEDAPWLVTRHVVGELDIEAVGSSDPGNLAVRTANRLRRTLTHGARSLPEPTEALFTGFVLGDDRAIDPVVVDDFRGAGLSHLLAVSGQNVAFVLALLAPMSRRLTFGPRLVVTVGVLSFFALLTRFEPSVLRATTMAGLAVVAAVAGREASSVRVLALAVTGLVLVDPLLVRSVAFQLSVAASLGIVILSAPLATRLPGPHWLRLPLAVTIAAQAAVAPVLLSTFGGLPVVAVPANLLAVPAAGPITVWGLTAGLVAGLAPDQMAALLHLPTRVLLEWVGAVAETAARLPLGEWHAPHVALLVGAAALLGLHRRRLAWVVVVCVALQPAVALWRSPPGPVVAADARIERRDGDLVLTLGDEPRPSDVLEGLRRAGIRHLDEVVVEDRSRRTDAVLDALRERFGAGFRVADAPCSFAACSAPTTTPRILPPAG